MPWQERSWRPFTLSHFSILPLAPSPARFNPPTGLLSTHRAIPPQPACTSHEIQLVHLEQYHFPSTQFRATCAHSFSLPPLSSWAILIGNRWKIVRGRGRREIVVSREMICDSPRWSWLNRWASVAFPLRGWGGGERNGSITNGWTRNFEVLSIRKWGERSWQDRGGIAGSSLIFQEEIELWFEIWSCIIILYIYTDICIFQIWNFLKILLFSSNLM